ncbi:MAG: EthD family reductase [Actinomycetota bacterium]|nr:EthD family reductase [Actinomycetota bacterium]
MKALIWVRKKDGMTDDEFRDHWLNEHAPIARDGYEHLKGYTVRLVTRVPEGQERPFDGIAELAWDDRDGFKADMKSEAAGRGNDDLKTFADAFGLLFVDEHVVK